MTGLDAGLAKYRTLADELLDLPGVTRSTMMGYPCLRVGGAFFGGCDRRTGELLVKLPEARVSQLVAEGRARSFAPNGHRFREWAAIPPERTRTWARLLEDALEFVTTTPKEHR